MKTGNFPRKLIENGQIMETAEFGDFLISITDINHEVARVTPGYFDKILYLMFDDVNEDTPRALSDGVAYDIAEFIKVARDLKKNVWVNCHAGICRSGALVSLMIDLGWEDAKAFGSPERIPNTRVYNKVRKNFPELLNSWEN